MNIGCLNGMYVDALHARKHIDTYEIQINRQK